MGDNELLPCPFCGGEARALKDSLPYVVIECERCFCRTNCNVTEKEAIEAWNARDERTCKPNFHNSYYGPCDCGYGVQFDMNYCPHCGAKVIKYGSE